jgi:hypothetical protein
MRAACGRPYTQISPPGNVHRRWGGQSFSVCGGAPVLH